MVGARLGSGLRTRINLHPEEHVMRVAVGVPNLGAKKIQLDRYVSGEPKVSLGPAQTDGVEVNRGSLGSDADILPGRKQPRRDSQNLETSAIDPGQSLG